MGLFSAVSGAFAQPSNSTANSNSNTNANESTTSNQGETAQANETKSGTSAANNTQTDTATTSDDGGANTGSSGATSPAVQSYSTAKDLSTPPAAAAAQSTVQAQLETPDIVDAEQAETAARQAALDAQQAYKMQSMLDAIVAEPADVQKIAPVAADPESGPPATSAEPEEMPV